MHLIRDRKTKMRPHNTDAFGSVNRTVSRL